MRIPVQALLVFAFLPSLSLARLQPHFIKRYPSNAVGTSYNQGQDHDECSSAQGNTIIKPRPFTNPTEHKADGTNNDYTTPPVVKSADKDTNTNADGTKTDYTVPPVVNTMGKDINFNAGLPNVTPTPQRTEDKSYGPTTPGPQKKGKNPAGGLLAANIFRSDFILGVAVRSEQLDGKYDECILPNANTIVPEYEFKTSHIHPQPKQYNFEPMDKIAAYAKKNGLNLRLHNFMWNQDNPEWLNDLKGNKAGLEAAMQDHIATLMGRYGSAAIQIDVVNEFMEYSGSGNPNNDLYYSTLGEDYLPFAFETTKKYTEHDTVAYLNDNDIEGKNYKNIPKKRAGLIRIVQKALKDGTPIGGIGMECHFDAGKLPEDFAESIQGFIDLGLDVMITELDIKSNGDIEQQAKDYATVYEACINKKGCKGVMRWNLDEDVSWETGSKAELFGPNCASKGLDEGVKKVLRTGRA
ncbi:hypothetical protein CBS101457_006266 [Exobasidium rhododendri]|nr:hypothetical protein CBS101457_006266 [Exobasidium rhododendri]